MRRYKDAASFCTVPPPLGLFLSRPLRLTVALWGLSALLGTTLFHWPQPSEGVSATVLAPEEFPDSGTARRVRPAPQAPCSHLLGRWSGDSQVGQVPGRETLGFWF